jgi:hypothetical protein
VHQPGRVTSVRFRIRCEREAPDWIEAAKALGLRVNNAANASFRFRQAYFVSKGAATIFLTQSRGHQTCASVIYPTEADLALIQCLRDCGLVYEHETEQVPA